MLPVLVVIQARTGSRRLPGKVLQDLAGRPMLGFQLDRLATLAEQPGMTGCRLVVATSDRTGDDAVADLGAAAGVAVVRGSEPDVLARFALALASHPAELVVRLTGDCPLTDPAIVAAAVAEARRTGAAHTSNVLPRSFPKGLDVEVLTAAALRTAAGEATAAPDREHVTPFLYRHPSRFELAAIDSGADLADEWWTVDKVEDLDRVRDVVAALPDPITAGWAEIVGVVGRRAGRPADAVHLRPDVAGSGADADGLAWVRRWKAVHHDRVVGTVAVEAGDDGAHRRHVDVPIEHQEATTVALDQLLVGDQQTRC